MARAKILDLRDALKRRDFPSVTAWNRVEGRPRSIDFDRALTAEIRDALWMLTRQWQVGEFQGEDGGSPVLAQYHLQTTRPTRYRPREEPPEDLSDELPLEAVAERRTVPFQAGTEPLALDLRLAMGRRWLRMVPAGLRGRFIERYPVTAPDPTDPADTGLVAHPEVWSTMAAVAGRTMDGYALYRQVTGGGAAHDGISGLSEAERVEIDQAAARFVAWFDDLISQPAGAGAWDPPRLEHRFALAAPAEAGERVLTAEEYPGGRLDWYSFSHDPSDSGLGAIDPAARGSVTRTVFPGSARFSGMPHPRWWALEDGQTNFAAVTPDTTDMIRLLFLEFALVYSNDWLLLPCDLATGTLALIDGLAITDVFGQRFWITPAGAGPDDAWQRWSMYNLDVAGNAPVAADTSLFLPAAVPAATEGVPLEEVVLIRDENANLVWGVERTVPLATGDPRRGSEAAAESLAHRRRLAPPVPAVPPAAPIRYEAMNTVPENWIPFIPVRIPGDTRQIQLQRGAMPRAVAGGPEKVRPRTTLLREGQDDTPARPYFVHEEEVPRAGTRITLAYQRVRWYGGRVVLWLGAHRTTGRGEGASGLAFDRAVDTPPQT
jgi:hypothetical protein